MRPLPSLSLISAALALGLVLPGHAPAQDWRRLMMQRQFNGEDLLRVQVEYGAGRLTIAPGTANSLFRASLRYDGNTFQPVNEYREGVLRLGVEGGSIKGANLKAGTLDLALGTDVPLDLNIKFGAAQADLELGGLRIQKATIQTGASETRLRVSQPNPERCSMAQLEMGAAKFQASGLGNLNCEDVKVSGGVGEVILDFSGEWRGDMSADVDMGLGSLVLRVPRDLGVSVRKQGVLAAFDSEGLTKRGNVYYSENYERADHKLTITIDAALGSIKMQWIEGSQGSR